MFFFGRTDNMQSFTLVEVAGGDFYCQVNLAQSQPLLSYSYELLVTQFIDNKNIWADITVSGVVSALDQI